MLAEETRIPGENQWSIEFFFMLYWVYLIMGRGNLTDNLSGDRHWLHTLMHVHSTIKRSWPWVRIMCLTGATGQVKPKTIKLVSLASLLKHTSLRRKSKDLLAQNQDNVSEWRDMSSCRFLIQSASIIKVQLGLVQNSHYYYNFIHK